MSIATAITNAQQKVAACYTAISNKGGTLPQTQDLSNMPTAITGIPSGGTVINNQNKTISTNGSYTADTGYTGLGTVTVEVPTVNNITLSATPTTLSQTFTPASPYTGYSSVTVSPVTASIDSNITAGNIKNGVSILGVTGTYSGSGTGTKYGATGETFLGDINGSGILQKPTGGSTSITFTGVQDVAQGALSYKFYQANSIGAVSFPALTTVSAQYSIDNAFENSSTTSLSFPELTTVSGQYSMQYLCRGCYNIQSINFPKLQTISGGSSLRAAFNNASSLTSCGLPKLQTVSGNSALHTFLNGTSVVTVSFPMLSSVTGTSVFTSCFANCRVITDIYFNALTTTSFGSNVNQFNNMFNNSTSGTAATSGNVNVHFPSNLSSTISGLTGYPLFGGPSGKITLLFDLTATS